MKLIIPILSLLIVLGLPGAAGCSDVHSRQTLATAEAIMDQRPDSALTLLRAIDASHLTGELRARHALLTAQALDKNCIDKPADSIINIALDYYRNSDDYPRERLMAFYYKGTARYNDKDYNEALYYLYIADTLAERAGYTKFRVLTNGLIGFSYCMLVDLSHQEKHSRKTLELCRALGDTIHIGDAMDNHARCLTQFDLYNDAYALLSQPECNVTPYTLAKCYAGLKRYNDYKDILARHPELTREVKLQSLYARKLLDDGRLDEAETLLDSIKNFFNDRSDSIHWAAAQRLRVRMSGDYRTAFDMLQQSISTELHSYNVRLANYQHTSRLRADEYVTALDLATEKSKQTRTKKTLIGTVIAAVLILFAVGTLYIHTRRQSQRAEQRISDITKSNDELRRAQKEQEAVINRLKAEKSAIEQRNDELAKQIMFNDKKVSISDEEYISHAIGQTGSLAEQYMKLPTNGESSEIRRKIEAQARLIVTPELVKRLDDFINRHHSNLMIKAKEAGLGKSELSLLRYLAGGFSRQQIELLLAIESGALNTRKSRLKAKLREAGFTSIPPLL